LSWLNTLGINKAEFDAFVSDNFDGYHFFTSSRGSANNVPASAEFNPKELKLENVWLFKSGAGCVAHSTHSFRIAQAGGKLEAYGVGQRHKAWMPTVKKQVEEIERSGWAKSAPGA